MNLVVLLESLEGMCHVVFRVGSEHDEWGE